MRPPETLKIEVTSHCNANCVYCDRRKADQAATDMPLDQVKEIVNRFPEATEVQPQFFGEPLLYQDFIPLLRWLKGQGKRIAFYTNGSLLDTAMADQIAAIAPDKVIFSVEASTAETFENIRKGLQWEPVLQNIRYFQSVKTTTHTFARMTICQENEAEMGDIINFWTGKVDSISAVHESTKVAGRITKDRTMIYNTCQRPYEQLVVKCNGDVVLCCTDWHGDYIVGNIWKDNGLWTSDRYHALRDKVRSSDPPNICKDCGFNPVNQATIEHIHVTR